MKLKMRKIIFDFFLKIDSTGEKSISRFPIFQFSAFKTDNLKATFKFTIEHFSKNLINEILRLF